MEIGDAIKGRWEIHRILHGGMGTVYIVFDRDWREPFAAKTFRDEIFAQNPRVADRFVDEARSWINLDDHENIVRARFVEQIGGKPYLFLEYVSGGDLSGWIASQRLSNDLSLALHFAIQLCDGMIYANSKGIQVHRDIKPQNCLVTEDRVLKVTDFGLAKAFDDALLSENPRKDFESAVIGLTQTGTALGTCTHMSPEQFYDARRVDTRADIYSFGVTLFQMLTGSLPFIGSSWKEFKYLHERQPVPPIPSLDNRLKTILEKCMAKRPNERFQTFGSLREELSRMFEKVSGLAAPKPKVGQELCAYSLVNKGVSLRQLDRIDEAMACYERALSLNPNVSEAWMNKAGALGILGRHREAADCCDRSLKINPRLPQAWFNKGIALSALGEHANAVSCFEEAHKLNPQNDNALYCKAIALSKTGQTEEAIRIYLDCVRANPNNADAWFNMAGLWRDLRKFGQSLACYEKATTINPNYAQAWFNKAHVLGLIGSFDASVEATNHALRLTPKDASAWFMKGVGLDALHRYQKAIESYRQAERLGDAHAKQAILNCERKLGR